jgi:hypothetical protein
LWGTVFEGLLSRGLLGLTYEFGASAGLLANVPALILMFRNAETAHQCFERFRSWQELTSSGDAVGLTFIEHPDGEFTICIYEEIDLFVRVAIPDELRDDLEPDFGAAVYSMRFRKQSDGYRSFKAAVEKSPFLLVPATQTIPPLWAVAISKRSIEILGEESVPQGSRAASILCVHTTAGLAEKRYSAPPWRSDLARLRDRRRRQLRRFYPVLLEQLRRDSRATDVTENLTACGFRCWQVEQAICNLNWSRRLDVPKYIAPTDEVDLMTTLVRTWERAELFSRTLDLELDRLKEQLRADAEQLLDYTGMYTDTTPCPEPQRLLEERGLLDG